MNTVRRTVHEWTRVTGRPDPRSFRCFANLTPDSLLFGAVAAFKTSPPPATVSGELQSQCMAVFSDGWCPPAPPPPFAPGLPCWFSQGVLLVLQISYVRC